MANRLRKQIFAAGLVFLAVAAFGCNAEDRGEISPKASLEERLEALKKSSPAGQDSPKRSSDNMTVSPPQPDPQTAVLRQSPPAPKNKPAPAPDPKKNGTYISPVTVQIFVTEASTYSHELENFLISNRIKYIKYDVNKDYSAKVYAKQLSGNYSVPVSLIGNKVIQGFDPVAIKKAVLVYAPPRNDKMQDYRF